MAEPRRRLFSIGLPQPPKSDKDVARWAADITAALARIFLHADASLIVSMERVTDGQVLTRSGTTVVGSAPGGGSGTVVTVNEAALADPTKADLDDTTPAPPADGSVNVKWQTDALSPTNISGYVPPASASTGGVVDLVAQTFIGTKTFQGPNLSVGVPADSGNKQILFTNDLGTITLRANPTASKILTLPPNNAASPAELVSVGGQIGNNGSAPDIRGMRETGAATLLSYGAVSNGQVLQRVGLSVVGASSSTPSFARIFMTMGA